MTTVEIDATPDEVRHALSAGGKRVVFISGYSGLGYEHEQAMLDEARRVFERFSPDDTLVCLGGTAEGVGAAYALAHELGFETVGIVSSQARAAGAAFSPYVDRVFVVEDERWGGRVDETGELSPTSRAIVESADLIVAIGGGDITRDEFLAARAVGRAVEFIPAEMNHSRARRAAAAGDPAAMDFRGSAHLAIAPEHGH
jgi:predicted Rossmann-fold nucleotide-binding protein